MDKKKFFNKNKKRFDGKKDRKDAVIDKKKEEKKKRKEAEAREKKRMKEMQERYKTLSPSFTVYEPFACPKEIEGSFFAESPIQYRSSDGKIRTFGKGQLVLRHTGGIISVLDGRYGKAV